ncbi:tRNA modification GTPase MnmE [Candidatus Hodgkinia cicadicola]|nr:tRNA modification GTPase MnmE [Candidatus Hodgkinia cicadicola]
MASKLPCAIATIRLSGENTFKILTTLLGRLISPNKVCALKIKTLKSAHDSVVTWWPCPYSPTGEDYAEISVAGTAFISTSIIRTLIKLSAVQARRGDFTKRAIINNKISVSNVLSLAKAFKLNYNIDNTKQIANNINNIIITLKLQLSSGVNLSSENYKIKSLILKIKQLRRSELAQICIIGKTNAGKSSLFNALVRQRKTIVSNLQGTTRDIIWTKIRDFTIADTAGFKETKNKVESAAVAGSFEIMSRASVVLVLSQFLDENVFIRCKSTCVIVIVLSKLDLFHKVQNKNRWVFVSAYTLEGIIGLRKRLYKLINEASSVNIADDIMLSQAQVELNRCVLTKDTAIQLNLLDKAKIAINSSILTPKLDNILNKFCVGK